MARHSSLRQEINAARNFKAACLKEIQAVQEKLGQRVADLQRRVRYGEVGGTDLEKFLILTYGLYNHDLEELFLSVDAELRGKIGQAVMVCMHHVTPAAFRTDSICLKESLIQSSYVLGILGGENLLYDRFLYRHMLPYCGFEANAEVIKYPYTFGTVGIPDLKRYVCKDLLLAGHGHPQKELRALELIIGDAAVKAFVDKNEHRGPETLFLRRLAQVRAALEA